MKIYTLPIIFSFNVITLANITNDFISDYFKYKNVTSVIGFSCNFETDDFSLIKKFNKNGVSAILRKLTNRFPIKEFAQTYYRKIGVFLDLRCYDLKSITHLLSQATEYRLYDELHYWLLLGSDINKDVKFINDNAFTLSTDFVIAIPSLGYLNTYNLYDAYNTWKERGASLNVTFHGCWYPNNTIKIVQAQSKVVRRANMLGLPLKTIFYSTYRPQNMSFEDYLQDYASSPKDGLSRFGFAIVSLLAEMFNFNLRYSPAPVWKEGDPLGPMVSGVYNNSIDITGSPPTMTSKRTYMIKFIHQSWPFRSCFIFRSPQPKNIKMHEILGPFEMQVWYSSAILFFLCTWIIASLFIFEKSHESSGRNFADSALLTVGAISQQGTDMKMNNMSTRIAFLCTMLASLLIYNYYSASIVSTRFSEPVFKLNDSLNQLAQTSLKLSSEWMVYLEFLFKKTDWDTQMFYTKRWKDLPKAEHFMDPEKAVELVRKGGFAYHSHPDVTYPFINRYYDNREICELTEVHLAQPTFCTFAISVNSTFLEMLKIGLMKISEVGIQKRQIKRWTSKKPVCMSNVLTASSLNIYEFAPHLLLLVIGMWLAFMICIIEKSKINKKFKKLKKALKFTGRARWKSAKR